MLIHVRYDGRSVDFDARDLRLNGNMSDVAVKQAVARRLDLGVNALNGYVVDRVANGNLIVRPEAVYG